MRYDSPNWLNPHTAAIKLPAESEIANAVDFAAPRSIVRTIVYNGVEGENADMVHVGRAI